MGCSDFTGSGAFLPGIWPGGGVGGEGLLAFLFLLQVISFSKPVKGEITKLHIRITLTPTPLKIPQGKTVRPAKLQKIPAGTRLLFSLLWLLSQQGRLKWLEEASVGASGGVLRGELCGAG